MAIAIIPARGGSKRVPKKNIQPLLGTPLIRYTIEQAKDSAQIDEVYVSTDDSDIAATSEEFGATVLDRPQKLASDEASTEAVLLHALEAIRADGRDPDVIVLLQCTSPMRRKHDIDEAVAMVTQEGYDSVVSCADDSAFAGFRWSVNDGNATPINYDPQNRPRSQEFDTEYYENGSIYVVETTILAEEECRLGGRIGIYPMPKALSFDIDTWEDIEIIEALMKDIDFYAGGLEL
jgi:N-acylneuraminate cytidylyltransferase